MTDWDQEGQMLIDTGSEEWQKGHRDRAVDLFKQVIERYPMRPEGYNKLGVIYAESRQLDLAEEHFGMALIQDKNYAPALSNLGNIYLERDNLDEAVHYYSLALHSSPDYAPAHRNISVAYRRLGKLSPYVSHLKHSQRLEMKNPKTSFSNQEGEQRRKALRIWLIILGVILVLGVWQALKIRG